jgi:MFS family permease
VIEAGAAMRHDMSVAPSKSLGRRLATTVLGPRRLARFAIAHALAAVSDAFTTISLAGSLFFNVSPNASRTQVLLYLIITMVPFTVLAPLVGPTVDRFPRSRRVVGAVCYALRALCCLAMAATLYQVRFYVFALVLLIVVKASGVVKYALVPRLVDDPAQLIVANSRLARMATVVGGVSGAIGAALLHVTSARTTLLAAAVLATAAMAAMLRVSAGDDHPHGPPPRSVEFNASHLPSVTNAALGLAALRGSVGFFVFMLAFTLRRDSEPAWVYGMVLAVYGAGQFSGNLVAPILRRHHHEDRLMLYALVAPAAVTAIGVLGVKRPIIVACAAVIGLSTTIGRQAFDSLLQRSAPDESRGSAFARYETRFQITWVIGAVLASAITLPPEVSMGLLTAMFVPAIALYVRGARESRRYDIVTRADAGASALALTRLATAKAWQRSASYRQAIIDASTAVDLALAAGATRRRPEDSIAIRRLDELRHLATDLDAVVEATLARDALQLAEQLVAHDVV